MIADKDKGLKALLVNLKKAHVRISVGVHAEEGANAEGAATVADVATWAEFGTSNAPARPWLSGWFDANQGKNAGILRAAGERITKGADPEQTLDVVAQVFAGQVQAGISAGVPPPNAQSTIRQKGSATPLIRTGQFRSSITGRVTRAA